MCGNHWDDDGGGDARDEDDYEAQQMITIESTLVYVEQIKSILLL